MGTVGNIGGRRIFNSYSDVSVTGTPGSFTKTLFANPDNSTAQIDAIQFLSKAAALAFTAATLHIKHTVSGELVASFAMPNGDGTSGNELYYSRSNQDQSAAPAAPVYINIPPGCTAYLNFTANNNFTLRTIYSGLENP